MYSVTERRFRSNVGVVSAILSWYPDTVHTAVLGFGPKNKKPRETINFVSVCVIVVEYPLLCRRTQRETFKYRVLLSIQYRIHIHYIPSRFEEKKKEVKGYSVVDHPCGRTCTTTFDWYTKLLTTSVSRY